MQRVLVRALAPLLVATLHAPVLAEDVEHPAYLSWARHPVGTTITMKSVTTSKGAPIETTTRTTLVALTPKSAVLEIKVVSNATGQVDEARPQRYEQKRMFPLFPGVKKEDVGKPSNAIARGEETLSLAGKEYKAQWFDSKGRTEAGETFLRTWMSDEVPGRLLKSVIRVPATKLTTTDELVEVKAP